VIGVLIFFDPHQPIWLVLALESFRTRRHSVRKLYSVIFDVQPEEIKKKMIAFTTSLKHLFRVRDKNFCTASDIPLRPAPNPIDFNLFYGIELNQEAKHLVNSAPTPKKSFETKQASRNVVALESESEEDDEADDEPSSEFPSQLIGMQTQDYYFLVLPTGFSKSSDFKLRGHNQDVIVEGMYIFDLPGELAAELSDCPFFEVPFSISHRLPSSVYSPTERHPVRFQSCCGIIFMFECRKFAPKQPVFSEIACRSFDRSATKIQAASDPSHEASPRSPSTPPPRNQEPTFVGFPSHPAKVSVVNPPDATQAPSDAATQSSVVRTRIDEPPISSSTLKVVATPTDLAFGLNVAQIESKQASPPATMNSVAAFASQLGNIQAQFGVSSASLNTSSLAAVSNALPLPINDIATAAAHYVKAQLLSAGPSSFSNLGTACLQCSAFVCFLTNILLANRRSPRRSFRFRSSFFKGPQSS